MSTTRLGRALRWVLGRSAFVLFGLVVGLAVTEGMLRLLGIGAVRHDLRGLHEPRPDRPWLYGMRPNTEVVEKGIHYRVNADGFRDNDYARPKPANTFRIVLLGQSVAMGYGVPLEKTFAKLLEIRLGRLMPFRHVEVLNLSIVGYNPFTEAALFTDVGVTYQPDLVLVQFGFNDLNDPTLHFDNATRLRLGQIPEAAFPAGQRYARPRPSGFARICGALRVCALSVRLRPPEPGRDLLGASLLMHNDIAPEELAWLRARYGEIATAASGIGARVVLLVMPFARQMQHDLSAQVHTRLGELGRDLGWPVIDLLRPLRREAREGKYVFIDNFHLSAAGNNLVANTLVWALYCRGLLPKPPGKECR